MQTPEKYRKQLVRFLRLRCVGGDDAFLLESIFRSEVWDFMNEPVSRTNEEAVNNLLATRCVRVRVRVRACLGYLPVVYASPAFLADIGLV